MAREWAQRTKPCCENCVYATRPVGKWWRLVLLQFPSLLACLNHPDGPGRLRETLAGRVCRNFRLRPLAVIRGDPPEAPEALVACIPLTQGKQALVDLADFARLNRHKWCAAHKGCKWYAARGKCVLMHRQIMKARKGAIVDHIDGNGLNNCRSNLRFCNHSQNSCNRSPSGKASPFKGIAFDKRRHKYYALLRYRGNELVFGPFDQAVEAARAHDRAAVQYHGEFAWLNFPEEWPPERRREVMAQRPEVPDARPGKGRKFYLGAPGHQKYRRKADQATAKATTRTRSRQDAKSAKKTS